MTGVAKDLLDASAVLEALRPQANNAIGSSNPADQPIRDAWDLALKKFREAYAAWVADP